MVFATAVRGRIVKKGQKVGYTTDYVDRARGDVPAPQGGVVSFIRGVPSLSKGATTMVTITKPLPGGRSADVPAHRLLVWAALFVATGTIAASIFTPAQQRLMAGGSAFAGSLIALALIVHWPWRWLRRAAAPAVPDAA